MTRTARVEPIRGESREAVLVSGWRVLDVTDPDLPQEISRHDTEPEAIEAARQYEHETSLEPGSPPDDTQDYDASDPQGGKEI
ncbi:hypothetical protein HNO51_09960 [Billgrantia sulfidoxydans]|uniref:Uncharacterized protein n=1 Tax=Billgrantia sulfidoxydans TaxID=2733484 RepID=A0ABX7W7J6_9GAMM|nr:hypothetical protein [Halomonas sulfidoxydans]QTP54974.1 hypothetical protein HNO51_09960 [Halomonas sulfidoxydans]